MTVEEEEIILATVGDKHDEEDNDEEALAAVAHYGMTHYRLVWATLKTIASSAILDL